MKNRIAVSLVFCMLSIGMIHSQEVNVKVGIKDSIQSMILNESRQLVVSLPESYHTGDKVYPVLYLLDGNETGLLDAILVTRKLRTEMIIVAIPNTDRDRDMMPLSTPTYEVEEPGAENFLSFLENS